jgi:hypothetical protein
MVSSPITTTDVQVDSQIPAKSLRLAKELFDTVQVKFPTVAPLAIQQSPEYYDDVWIYVRLPDDEQMYDDFSSFTAELSIDILVQYGFQIIFLPYEPMRLFEHDIL